jgi:hypothetical protein
LLHLVGDLFELKRYFLLLHERQNFKFFSLKVFVV